MGRVENARNWFEGMNAKDVDKALSGLADDIAWFGFEQDGSTVTRKTRQGPEVRPYFQAWMAAASEDITYTIKSAREIGDCVLIEWEDVATRETGEEYRNEGVMAFEFEPNEDRAARVRSYTDFGPLSDWNFLDKTTE